VWDVAPVKTVRRVKRKTPAWKAAEQEEVERELQRQFDEEVEMERKLEEQGERMIEAGMATRRTLRGRVVEYC
jgi:hypothetical protein